MIIQLCLFISFNRFNSYLSNYQLRTHMFSAELPFNFDHRNSKCKIEHYDAYRMTLLFHFDNVFRKRRAKHGKPTGRDLMKRLRSEKCSHHCVNVSGLLSSIVLIAVERVSWLLIFSTWAKYRILESMVNSYEYYTCYWKFFSSSIENHEKKISKDNTAGIHITSNQDR